jgi:TolB-like protein
VILRCLAKDPAARFASATELAQTLQSGAPRSSRPALRGRPWVAGAAAVAGALLLVAGAYLVAHLLRARASGSIESLAVLPLANLSGDPGQEYFADGMTDELITALAQIGALKVISRTSVMKYKSTLKSLPQIARELHVDGILEGSVARAGDEVRISAQLIQATTDRHLWTASYRRQLSNALELQDEVARAVAEQVRIELTPQARARLTRTRTVDPRALEAYLRGRAYLGQWTRETSLQAIESFRRAIEIAPENAAAHAGLAMTYCVISSGWMPAREAMPRARAAAARALELDSTLALARSVMSYVSGFYDWNWREAESGFRHAIELDPNEAFAHQMYGYALTVNGRLDEAIAELQRAHELDPLALGISSMQLWPYNMGRRYEQAIHAAQELLQADSTAWDAHVVLEQSYTQLGRYDEALAQARLLPNIHPATQGYVYAKAGRTREAWQLLAQGENQLAGPDSTRYGVLYDLAILRAALGDRERAIQYLQRAMAQREEDVVWVKLDPRLDLLRSDPRFHQIQRQVGFAD